MASATVLNAWQDGKNANLAVVVLEADSSRVEYVGTVPLARLALLTNAQVKAALVAAVKAQRDASLAAAPLALAITGQVTI